MFSPEYEKRLLKHFSPTARRLFDVPESSSPSDRFIPCRYCNIEIHKFQLKKTKKKIINSIDTTIAGRQVFHFFNDQMRILRNQRNSASVENRLETASLIHVSSKMNFSAHQLMTSKAYRMIIRQQDIYKTAIGDCFDINQTLKR